MQTGINTFGTNIIVAHTGARKITILVMTPFFVLGTALATYCGQNLGAGEYLRIKQGIKSSILDAKTPLVSSFIELAGKVLIAWILVPKIGYWGIILSEPVVWVVMVIPLLIGMRKFYFHYEMQYGQMRYEDTKNSQNY